MLSPQNFFRKLFRFPRQIRYTFFSAIIAGFLAHIYMMTNKLPYQDETISLYVYGTGARSGRWFLDVLGLSVQKLFGTFSMPFFNGFLSILILAVSACVVVSVFGISDLAFCAFTGALFTIFPTVTCSFLYMFTSPYELFSVLLITLSAYYIIRGGYYNLPGIILFVLSAATYQAYFPLGIAILAAKLIQDIEHKHILKRALRYAVCCLSGVTLYLLSVPLVRHLFHVRLLSYKNADNMTAEISLHRLFRGSMIAYQSMIRCISSGYYGLTEYRILRLLLALFLAAGLICIIIKLYRLIKARKSGNAVLLCIFSLLFPISVFSLYLCMNGDNMYALTMYPCCGQAFL